MASVPGSGHGRVFCTAIVRAQVGVSLSLWRGLVPQGAPVVRGNPFKAVCGLLYSFVVGQVRRLIRLKQSLPKPCRLE